MELPEPVADRVEETFYFKYIPWPAYREALCYKNGLKLLCASNSPWLRGEPATLQNLVDGSFPIEYAFVVS